MSEPTDSSDAPETMSTPPQTEETPRQAAGAAEDSSAAAGPGPGRVARATAWGKASARRAGVVADRERGRHASVDVGFRTVERQRRVAAMVLAGGIAYRIFFWLLALSVVVSGVLGFFDPDAVADRARAPRRRRLDGPGGRAPHPLVGRQRVVAAPRRGLAGALDGLHVQQGARARPRDDLGSRRRRGSAGRSAPRCSSTATRSASSRRWRLRGMSGSRARSAGSSRRCSCSASRSASGCSRRTACRTRPRAGSSSCPERWSSRWGSRRCTCSPSTSSARSSRAPRSSTASWAS